ncbi:hypothetical protein NAT47_01290 [Flavobacterium sp. HXWNR69]|uniref:DUF4136 domain-containing protein n=2 Tax=Flavobacterium fragile TaxID=2949085 RepID=A0ABT0TDJ4_9FLAO|nr:hypothetical protein [Flavobacterium sp. HXWNR69]
MFLVFLFSSCNLPKYYFKDDSITTGVDFSEGKWLLDRIQTSKENEDKLTKMTTDFFEKKLDQRFNTVFNEKVLISQKNNFPLSSEELKQIKIGTNYDFFIQIKSGNSKNELGAIDATPARFNSNLTNEASIQLIIYDLNTKQVIYHKNAFGVTGNPEKSNSDVTFSKSSQSLLFGSLKKIFKDLDEKSIL